LDPGHVWTEDSEDEGGYEEFNDDQFEMGQRVSLDNDSRGAREGEHGRLDMQRVRQVSREDRRIAEARAEEETRNQRSNRGQSASPVRRDFAENLRVASRQPSPNERRIVMMAPAGNDSGAPVALRS
jgi:hypothetical protein